MSEHIGSDKQAGNNVGYKKPPRCRKRAKGAALAEQACRHAAGSSTGAGGTAARQLSDRADFGLAALVSRASQPGLVASHQPRAHHPRSDPGLPACLVATPLQLPSLLPLSRLSVAWESICRTRAQGCCGLPGRWLLVLPIRR